MSDLTVIFYAVVALAAAVVAIPLFRGRTPWDVEKATELDRLLESKARVLRGIKDVDHEREAGLLADQDWQETREEYVAEAVRLNREIAAITGIDPAAEPAK